MGAEYLSYVKSIATFALTFYGCIILVLDSVYYEWFIRQNFHYRLPNKFSMSRLLLYVLNSYYSHRGFFESGKVNNLEVSP